VRGPASRPSITRAGFASRCNDPRDRQESWIGSVDDAATSFGFSTSTLFLT
jgi:hypothetical protein